MSVEGMAEDVLQLIEALELERPNILGWSLGGMVTTALVARHGANVGNVVLTSAVPGGRDTVEGPSSALYTGPSQLETDASMFAVETPEGGCDAGCRLQRESLQSVHSRATSIMCRAPPHPHN